MPLGECWSIYNPNDTEYIYVTYTNRDGSSGCTVLGPLDDNKICIKANTGTGIAGFTGAACSGGSSTTVIATYQGTSCADATSCIDPSPSPTRTPSASVTPTPSVTPTRTPSATPDPTPCPSSSPTTEYLDIRFCSPDYQECSYTTSATITAFAYCQGCASSPANLRNVDTNLNIEVYWNGDLGGSSVYFFDIPSGNSSACAQPTYNNTDCNGEFFSYLTVTLDPSSFGSQIYQYDAAGSYNVAPGYCPC
jgi:hypothetical protein